MTDPILFCTKPSGRIEAKFGRHTIGVIEPFSPEMVGMRGNGCSYQIKISELRPAQEARSIAWARQQLLFRIADWFDGGGEAGHPIANLIRNQAEAERAAA